MARECSPSPLYSGERAGVRGFFNSQFAVFNCYFSIRYKRPLTLALSPEYGGEGTGSSFLSSALRPLFPADSPG